MEAKDSLPEYMRAEFEKMAKDPKKYKKIYPVGYALLELYIKEENDGKE